MTAKKRKPKAITPKRVTTEATKRKLPSPKRKRKKETWAEGYAKWEAKVRKAFDDARDSLTERNGGPAPRAIPLPPSPIAGQPLDGICSVPAPDLTAIPVTAQARQRFT